MFCILLTWRVQSPLVLHARVRSWIPGRVQKIHLLIFVVFLLSVTGLDLKIYQFHLSQLRQLSAFSLRAAVELRRRLNHMWFEVSSAFEESRGRVFGLLLGSVAQSHWRNKDNWWRFSSHRTSHIVPRVSSSFALLYCLAIIGVVRDPLRIHSLVGDRGAIVNVRQRFNLLYTNYALFFLFKNLVNLPFKRVKIIHVDRAEKGLMPHRSITLRHHVATARTRLLWVICDLFRETWGNGLPFRLMLFRELCDSIASWFLAHLINLRMTNQHVVLACSIIWGRFIWLRRFCIVALGFLARVYQSLLLWYLADRLDLILALKSVVQGVLLAYIVLADTFQLLLWYIVLRTELVWLLVLDALDIEALAQWQLQLRLRFLWRVLLLRLLVVAIVLFGTTSLSERRVVRILVHILFIEQTKMLFL